MPTPGGRSGGTGTTNEGLGRKGVWATTFLALLPVCCELIYRLVFLRVQEISVPPFRNLFALFTISILTFSILKTKG